jgi:hypothetical protein
LHLSVQAVLGAMGQHSVMMSVMTEHLEKEPLEQHRSAPPVG